MLYYESSTRQRQELPPIGRLQVADARKLFDDRARYDGAMRVLDLSRCRRAELYDECSHYVETANDTHPYQWRELDPGQDRYSIPLPVLNHGALQRQNESARLGRPEYRPVVRPSVEKPSLKVRLGARKATDVLKSELKRMGWESTRLEGEYHQPLYGGWTLLSYWDQRWDQSVNVPVRTAMACPRHPGAQAAPMVSSENADQPPGPGLGVPPSDIPAEQGGASEPCPFVVAASQTPSASIQDYGGPLAETLTGAESMMVQRCPLCGDHPKLVPFMPTAEESQGQDVFGRPLNQNLARGEWLLRNASPYDVWWENSGVDIRGAGEELTWIHVESLDWIALHYPAKARQVRPESPSQLCRYHPVAGSPAYRAGAGMSDLGLFRNHCRVKEFHKKPWMEWSKEDGAYKFNLGRSIVLANNVLLFDGPLLIQSLTNPEKWEPRIDWYYSAWEPRAGGRRIQGISQWEFLWDPQDLLNETVAQRASVRQRCAVPLYLTRKSFNLGQPGLRPGLPGTWVEFDTDANAPAERPVLINNETIDDGVVQEQQDAKANISELGGANQIEKGNVPGNVGAATAISMLKTESAEHRRPRVARNRIMMAAAWSHGLRLIAALWLEPRPYATEDTHGNESWKSLHGLDLYDQTNVEILPEPAFDTEDERRESIRDNIQIGLIDMQDPATRRTAARLLGAPPEFYQRERVQEEAAEREYQHFIDAGKFPVLDPTIDDHALHYDRHGLDCHTEEFRDLEEAAGWDDVLSIIGHTFAREIPALKGMLGQPAPFLDPNTGTFVMMERQALAQIPIVGPDGAPQINPMTGQPAVATQPLTNPDGSPKMEQVPQMGPPLPLQDMIKNIWVDLLSRQGYTPPGVEPGQEELGQGQIDALGAVLAWRAHLEAHKLQTEAMAIAQQPMMPAPGQQTQVAAPPAGEPAGMAA